MFKRVSAERRTPERGEDLREREEAEEELDLDVERADLRPAAVLQRRSTRKQSGDPTTRKCFFCPSVLFILGLMVELLFF